MKKTVLITGASSGIGEAFAKAYAKKGYRLILCARRTDRLEKLAEDVKTECVLLPLDLEKEENCYLLAKKMEEEDLDVFINNAGFGLAGSFLETDISREISMVKVNDIAQHILFKKILQQMEKRGHGHILNVASSAGLFPGGPYMAGYYASKAYMASLSRAVAQELKEKGSRVAVSALCPGPVDTEFNERAEVLFSLKGISAEYCVQQCLKGMEKKKVIIIPGVVMKAAVFFSRFLPASIAVKLTGRQQKKKIYNK